MATLPKRECHSCGGPIEQSEQERSIVARIFLPDLPVPLLRQCAACRMRQRLAFRNERALYRRSCALTGKPIISVYRPDAPVTVYDQAVWWSDRYDPLAYGREIDFQRPFFEQLAELHAEVPKLCIHNAKSENCDYTNYSSENRNCYLLVGGLEAEDCYYGYRVFYSKNIVDCFAMSRCELCYECVQGVELYGCTFSTNCTNSSALHHCEDCVGCKECFGSINLRSKQYYIFNEPHSPEEYTRRVAALRADPRFVERRLAELRASLPLRSTYTTQCEACSGDQLRGCQRCDDAYFVYDSQDVVHARNGENNRDCVDLNFGDNCELQFQAANLEKNYRVAFACLAWYVSESFYVLSCFNSKNLFGCCGMKRHEYCILNRQYTPAAYQQTVQRLVDHMVDTGEWGSYFPPQLSPFLYQESVAADLFPMSDAECRRLGFHSGEPPRAPANAAGAEAESCLHCRRPFRVVPQEDRFYQQLGLSRPGLCPECRHTARMKRRRAMELRAAACCDCGVQVPASTSASQVRCEACFVEGLL